MSIKVLSGSVHSNTMALLNNSFDSKKPIGKMLEESKVSIANTLNNLKKKPDPLSGSMALRQLKLLATDNYVIDAKSKTDAHHSFDGQSAYRQLMTEIDSLGSNDKARLADTAIALLKQGENDKFTQEQLMELSSHASTNGKVDLYISLLNDRNQSNKNIVDNLLPRSFATALREGYDLVINPKDNEQALTALEIATEASRAYPVADKNNRNVLQLITGDSIRAIQYQTDPTITSVAHNIVSGDLAQDAVSLSLKERDPYSSLQTLKTLLGNTKKLDSFVARDLGSLTSIVATSSDSEYLLKNLAQSGVLNSEAVQKVYSNILRHNDAKKDRELAKVFLDNLEAQQPLSSSDYLKLYKRTLTHARNQPISDALETIYQQAQSAEAARRQEDAELNRESQDNDTNDIREIVSLHSMVLSKCDQISSVDDITLTQLKPVSLIVNGGNGQSAELDLSKLNSPAELNLILEELDAKEVVVPESENTTEDYLTTDIKLAVEDYINGDDDRLSIYLTKPISEAAPLIAEKLKTDVFHIASLTDTRLVSRTPKMALKDSLADIGASIKFTDDNEKDASAYVVGIENVKSNYDLIEHARLYKSRVEHKKPQSDETVSVKVKVESGRLSNEFLNGINERLTKSIERSLGESGDNSKPYYLVNKDVDDILCLPVTALSDKIKTNTIFNDKATQLQKTNNNQTKLSR